MPICTLSVSPWTIDTFSIGMPRRTGDELGEGRLVALAVTVRAGQNLDRADRIDALTSADSQRPTPAPSEPTAADGAMPQASM